MVKQTTALAVACLVLQLFAVTPANAYVGPGLGLSAIGGALALLGATVLAIVGFVWYPLKRIFGAKSDKEEADGDLEPERDPGKTG